MGLQTATAKFSRKRCQRYDNIDLYLHKSIAALRIADK